MVMKYEKGDRGLMGGGGGGGGGGSCHSVFAEGHSLLFLEIQYGLFYASVSSATTKYTKY